MTKRILSVLLAGLLLAPALSACSSETPEDTTATAVTTAPAVTTTAETTTDREHYPDTLPDLNYNGEAITIHVRADSTTEVFSEEETGETVNDAVYQRNSMVSERLNVVIQPILGSTWNKYAAVDVPAIRASVTSGTGAYDVVVGWSSQTPPLAIEGLFRNLLAVDHLNLTQPWWNQSIVNDLPVQGKLPFLIGDIGLTYMSAMYTYVFNQAVAADRKVEDLYQVVRDGGWTMDYVHSLTSNMYADLDGDGARTAGDFYGLVTDSVNCADGYMNSSQMVVFTRDSDDMPVLDPDLDKWSLVVEKTYKLLWENPGSFTREGDGKPEDFDIFVQGRSLLMPMRFLQVVQYLAEMEDDYGLLPYPKLTEEQEGYGTRIQDGLGLWCLPIDGSDPAMLGAFLEAMAAQSYRTVTPAYLETALKARYSRDPETAEMIDLIRDSAQMRFEIAYSTAVGRPWMVLRDLMKEKNNNFASWWATNKPLIESKLANTIEQLKKLN